MMTVRRPRFALHLAILICTTTAAIALVNASADVAAEGERSAARAREARTRAEAALRQAQQDESSLRLALPHAQGLARAGLTRREDRLLLIEWLNALRLRHRLIRVGYEIGPQRPLRPVADRDASSIEPLGSRVTLRIEALHEADLIDFLRAVGAEIPATLVLTDCRMTRLDAHEVSAGTAAPRIRANCALESITLREKQRVLPS